MAAVARDEPQIEPNPAQAPTEASDEGSEEGDAAEVVDVEVVKD
ncbi:MAG: hypothetical protein AAFV46_06500 [Cyanobacteria bacterium J06635_11]